MIEYQITEEDRKHPERSGVFVYYKNLKSGFTDNMPLTGWLEIQRNRNRKDKFALVRYVNPRFTQKPLKTRSAEQPEVEEDPLECPLCGYVAKDDKDLGDHKSTDHK